MDKRKLSMDDIRKGMYITVLRGKVEQRMLPSPNGPKIRYKEKDHYNGKVLEVIAVDMPYVVVKCHEARGTRNDAIDLRHVEVMAITPEYIFALLPDFEIKTDLFWGGVKDDSLENADTTIEEIMKDL